MQQQLNKDSTPSQKDSNITNKQDDAKRATNDNLQDPSKCDNPNSDKKPGIVQRFKDAYKEYGKILIGVHLVTSIGWFGGFYYMAKA